MAAKSRTSASTRSFAHSRSEADCGKIVRETSAFVRSGKSWHRTSLVPHEKHVWYPKRTSFISYKSFSSSNLVMRSGRLGAGGPNGRPCGSDPPENGPRLHRRAFRRGRSRDFSLQEGGPATRDLEAATTTVRTVLRHSPDSRRCLGRGSPRQPVRSHVTAQRLSAANVAPAVTVAESFANRSRFEIGTDSPSS